MEKIKIKKFDTQNEALEFQKSITGQFYFQGFERNSLDKIMDKKKGNNLPYMVDITNGDIYYIFNCPDGLEVLNKFQLISCLTGDPFRKVFLKDDIIEIEKQGTIEKNSVNRKILADNKQIVCS